MKIILNAGVQCGSCGYHMAYNGYQPFGVLLERGFRVVSCENGPKPVSNDPGCPNAGILYEVPLLVISDPKVYDPDPPKPTLITLE